MEKYDKTAVVQISAVFVTLYSMLAVEQCSKMGLLDIYLTPSFVVSLRKYINYEGYISFENVQNLI